MIDFITSTDTHAAFGVIVSFLALILSLIARSKKTMVLFALSTAFMGLAALDLMTNTMVIPVLAELIGLAALLLLLASFPLIWQHRAIGAICLLFGAAFYGLMASNLAIERFGSRSEWWYNFQTFQAWAFGATLLMLLPAAVVVVHKTRQVLRASRTPERKPSSRLPQPRIKTTAP